MRVAMSALVVLTLVAPAEAQIVRWTDERGEVHIGNLESVPERYREGAKVLSSQGAPSAGGGPVLVTPGSVPSVGSGSTTIHFKPGKEIMAIARINASAVVSLLVDTGADTTTIHASVMRALGVDLSNAPTRRIRGVGGSSRASVVTLERLDIGDATVAPLRVDVMETGMPGQGLLGRDFLSHFEVQMDNKAGILTLRGR